MMRTTRGKLTIVSQDLRVHTLGARTFAPDCDFGGITSKGGNVLIDPSEVSRLAHEFPVKLNMSINSPECLPLVPKAVVGNTSIKSLLSHQKAVGTQPVVDADPNHRCALLNAVLDDEGEIVSSV